MADATKDGMVEGRTNEYPVPKSKKGNTFLFLGVGLFLVILAVIGGIFLFAPGLISKEAAEKGQGQGTGESTRGVHGHVYSMEPFLVNLADPDQGRYLKVKIDIESTEKKPNEEYQQRLSQLRDSVLTVLSTKRYQDIFDSEGKKKLKEEIISKLNQLVSHFKVKTIYFIEFVVQ
ncbi:MAG: flagellar basal body-associated FliL family protein [Deltaproteobacteria bacterium]